MIKEFAIIFKEKIDKREKNNYIDINYIENII